MGVTCRRTGVGLVPVAIMYAQKTLREERFKKDFVSVTKACVCGSSCEVCTVSVICMSVTHVNVLPPALQFPAVTDPPTPIEGVKQEVPPGFEMRLLNRTCDAVFVVTPEPRRKGPSQRSGRGGCARVAVVFDKGQGVVGIDIAEYLQGISRSSGRRMPFGKAPWALTGTPETWLRVNIPVI